MTKRHDLTDWLSTSLADVGKKSVTKATWSDHPNHKLHDAIVAHYAPKIAEALKDSTHGIHEAIVAAQRSAKKSLAKNAADDAQAAVNAHVTMQPQDAANMLRQLLGDSYLAGSHSAVVQMGGSAKILQSLESAATGLDWSNWQPGWLAAAGNVRDGGLADLLSQAMATIQGIQDNAMTRLGNVLADGIASGDSVDTIATSMSDLIASPERAFVIADTEVARSMTQATLSTYDQNDVTQYEWLAEDDACPICDDLNGQTFDVSDSPEQPPEHPSCRCAILPVIDGQDNAQPTLDSGDDDDSDSELAQSVMGEIAKWGDSWQTQERDDHGRFGSGGGGNAAATIRGGSSSESGQSTEHVGASGSHVSYADNPRPGMGDIRPSAGMIADLGKEGSTAAPYINAQGQFTPERQALHDSIVSKALQGTSAVDNPKFTMMGGGASSGKSSTISAGYINTENAVRVNADDIKPQLPEVQAMQAAGDITWAGASHEESSYIAARIQAASFESSRNTILDGTGDSSVEKLTGKIEAAKAAGYTVEGQYVTVNIDTAMERATLRAANPNSDSYGRIVPEGPMRATYAALTDMVPQVASKFDSFSLHDNNGTSLRLIASQQGGSPVTVHDPEAYQGFLNNGA